METALQFKAGDYMMYGTVGVCQVKEISRLSFMRDKKLYYTLVPVFDRGSMIYIPVDNQKVVMRPVISREEAEVFIEQLPKFQVEKYANRNERLQACKEMLVSGDKEKWAAMVNGLFQLGMNKRERGRSLTINEAESMKKAENLLFGELAVALGLQVDQVPEYIGRKLQGE